MAAPPNVGLAPPEGGPAPIQVIIQTGPAAPVPTAIQAAAPPVGIPVKSKLVAGLLGIFLGFLGIHRFYLGYVGIGIAQVVLTVLGVVTCGISTMAAGVWGLVDGILILTGSIDRDSQNRPLKN